MPTANVAYHSTLVLNAVQTVTLTDAREVITVTNRTGVTGIYFTVGTSGQTPSAPTVGGNDCYVAPEIAGATKSVLVENPPAVISLIAGGTPSFSVESDLVTPVVER